MRVEAEQFYGGAQQRIVRLGLSAVWSELRGLLGAVPLNIEESRHANGGAAIRESIDEAFTRMPGWSSIRSGGIDWSRNERQGEATVAIGVEIQMSGRSDLLIVDVAHLRDGITSGTLDVGVIVVPTDRLARFLTDRAPNFTAACDAIHRARAGGVPLAVLGVEHDGVGPPLAKRRTNRGAE